jgi:hypothetical protein
VRVRKYLTFFFYHQYPFTTLIPNLGVWIPSQAVNHGVDESLQTEGSGSEGLVLCVSIQTINVH